MHYVHKKARYGPEIVTFGTKNSPFLSSYTFKLAGNNWIEGGPGSWSSILLLVTVVSEKCQKETEETIGVFGEKISIGKGGRVSCPPPPPGYARLCSKWGKQKRCSQMFREVSGVFQRNFNCSKNSAVLEPRTGQFSRPRPRTSKGVLEDSTSVGL